MRTPPRMRTTTKRRRILMWCIIITRRRRITIRPTLTLAAWGRRKRRRRQRVRGTTTTTREKWTKSTCSRFRTGRARIGSGKKRTSITRTNGRCSSEGKTTGICETRSIGDVSIAPVVRGTEESADRTAVRGDGNRLGRV